jgi:hypothetical protein|tara:strand:+ start:3906 stop:4679 length:774 start_codon:yes stop_codon:yes gene_type:complete
MANRPVQSVSASRGSNSNYKNYIRNSRWKGPAGAEPVVADGVTAKFRPRANQDGSDWRVKITLPSVSNFRTSPLLQPLEYTDYSVVFPITPNISMVNSANYDEITHVHTNYPFPQFTNSRVEDITIVGEFPVQNEEDGRYWVAATHFFRSVTKMAYGETSNKGAPPPICKLNGYGDFVLNNVPIVITSFTSDIPNNVDYIRVPIYTESNGTTESRYSMVPTNSNISITCKVIYSRKKVETFSLDKFVNGDLIDKGFL